MRNSIAREVRDWGIRDELKEKKGNMGMNEES